MIIFASLKTSTRVIVGQSQNIYPLSMRYCSYNCSFLQAQCTHAVRTHAHDALVVMATHNQAAQTRWSMVREEKKRRFQKNVLQKVCMSRMLVKTTTHPSHTHTHTHCTSYYIREVQLGGGLY